MRAMAVCALALGMAGTACAMTPAEIRASAVPGSSKDRSHGYLGIEFHDTTDEQASALHLQGARGAEVEMVDHDGPAGKAGLQPHDIVMKIDNQIIETAEDLSRMIRESGPGKVISLSILRLGKMMTLKATLANREELEHKAWQEHMQMPMPPPPDDGVDNVLVDRYTTEASPARSPMRGQSFLGSVLRTGPYTGVTLETMEPQLAVFFGAPPKAGLLVHGVDNNSPAEAAGLRAGDVVLRVDSAVVTSTSEWTKKVRNSKGHALAVTVLRDKHEQTLQLTPDLKRHSSVEMPKGPYDPLAPMVLLAVADRLPVA